MTLRALFSARSGGASPLVLLAASLLAGLVLLPLNSSPAAAQGFPGFFDEAPRYKPRVKRRQTARPRPADTETAAVPPAKIPDATRAAEPAKPKGPLFVVVSLADQQITIYNHDGVVTKSRVSTGMAGHPTPKGVFTIIGRERYHHSNIYSGAPMPFMQRVTWSGVAMHLGVVPGYPASHGCIRLPAGFAAQLWGLTKIGERVVIARHDVHPAPISHANLPEPKMQPADNGIATGSTVTPQQVAEVKMPSGDASVAPVASDAPKLLNPVQYAEVAKARTAAEAASTAKAAQALLASAAAKKAEATKAAARLKTAEAAQDAADRKAAAVAATVAAAAPEKREALDIANLNAQSEALSAMSKLRAAREDAAAKDAEWSDEVRRWREATAAADAAREAQRLASRRASPVSVLVSKKDGKVYVRQGLAPLFEAAATVKSPEKPLGTHLYVASAVGDDGQSLKWTAITMPGQAAEPERARKTKPGQKQEIAPPPSAASSAAEALDRIEIPDDARLRISELVWTGSSLIVSDQPLSGETSDIGTDLVVTVR